jgi:hypothetical protein
VMPGENGIDRFKYRHLRDHRGARPS